MISNQFSSLVRTAYLALQLPRIALIAAITLISALATWFAERLAHSTKPENTNIKPEAANKPMMNRNDGPPDLDEVFREWKKKLEKIFGDVSNGMNKGNKNSSGSNGGGKNFLHSGLIGIAAIALLVIISAFWLFSGLYIVDSNERAVIMQFGRFTHTAEPGLNWRLPYPFESHEKVVFSSVRTLEIAGQPISNSRQASQTGPRAIGAQMLTGDENVLVVHYTVQYDVVAADYYVLNDVAPDVTARLAAEAAMREVVGSSSLDRVLYEDREVVANNARDIMQSILDRYKVGIRVIRVNLQSVRPPEQVQAAFDDAIKASQDRQRQVNEGEAYAQDIVPRAKGAASRLLEQAAGYSSAVVSRAEGEASRFTQIYDQYKVAKEVTRERMYLDTMADVLGRSNKVVIDPNSRSILNLATTSDGNKITPIIINENAASNSMKTLRNTSSENAKSATDLLFERLSGGSN